jgi:hypothetical protein
MCLVQGAPRRNLKRYTGDVFPARAHSWGGIKDHPEGAQLGAQQAGTNSVAISIQGMPFGHHTMLLPKFVFPWSMRWCV